MNLKNNDLGNFKDQKLAIFKFHILGNYL